MKYSSITTLLLALVASSATAEFLRNSNSPLSMDSFTSETIRRRLNANTDLINKVIKAILPTLNTGLQAAIPDPFTVDQTASFSPGTVNSGSCSGQNAQVTVSYTLQQLTGQNTTQISSLTVREGTESVRCGCGHQDFSGTFDIVLGKIWGVYVQYLRQKTRLCRTHLSFSLFLPSLRGQQIRDGWLCQHHDKS